MRIVCCLLALSCVSIFPRTAALAESQQEDPPVLFTESDKSAPVSTRQILVRVQLAEVSLSKMRKLGFDFAVSPKNFVAKDAFQAFSSGNSFIYTSGTFCDLLDAQVKNKVARIIANHTILTHNGKEATFFVGGAIDVANESEGASNQPNYLRFGTELKVLTTVLAGDRVALDLMLDISTLRDGEKSRRCIRDFKIDTSLEVQFGNSALLASSTLNKKGNGPDEEDSILLLVVTPEAFEENATVKQHQTK